jgi:hypothetical protein
MCATVCLAIGEKLIHERSPPVITAQQQQQQQQTPSSSSAPGSMSASTIGTLLADSQGTGSNGGSGGVVGPVGPVVNPAQVELWFFQVFFVLLQINKN